MGMSVFSTEVAHNITFTDKAASQARQLAESQGKADLMLRVFVEGGGCSGFQYGFDFEDTVKEGDTVIENKGARLLVDAMSIQYLRGAEVDYVDGLQGAQFVINNPNAQSTCGCGTSFSV